MQAEDDDAVFLPNCLSVYDVRRAQADSSEAAMNK